jgi:hypothetical protein
LVCVYASFLSQLNDCLISFAFYLAQHEKKQSFRKKVRLKNNSRRVSQSAIFFSNSRKIKRMNQEKEIKMS